MSAQHLLPPAARRERMLAKRQAVLKFLGQEGFTTTEIVAQLLHTTRWPASTALRALRLANMIVEHRLETELGPVSLWGISTHGFLMSSDGIEGGKYYEPGRLSASTHFHALDVQRVRLLAEQSGWKDWDSSRICQRRAFQEKGVWLNVPDAIAISPDGERVAVEVERTFKSPKRYHAIYANYLQMVRARTIDRIAYVCMVEGMAIRLRKLFDHIDILKIQGTRHAVNDSHRAKLRCYEFSNWPNTPAII